MKLLPDWFQQFAQRLSIVRNFFWLIGILIAVGTGLAGLASSSPLLFKIGWALVLLGLLLFFGLYPQLARWIRTRPKQNLNPSLSFQLKKVCQEINDGYATHGTLTYVVVARKPTQKFRFWVGPTGTAKAAVTCSQGGTLHGPRTGVFGTQFYEVLFDEVLKRDHSHTVELKVDNLDPDRTSFPHISMSVPASCERVRMVAIFRGQRPESFLGETYSVLTGHPDLGQPPIPLLPSPDGKVDFDVPNPDPSCTYILSWNRP